MDMDDDDLFLYGGSKPPTAESSNTTNVVPTSVPQPISVEQIQYVTNGLVKQLEQNVAQESRTATPEQNGSIQNGTEEGTGEDEGEEDEEAGEDEEEEEESDDDVEIIMEPPTRSLDFRQQRPQAGRTSSNAPYTAPNRPPAQPQPSLTTEYTPRERGGITKLSSTPQPSSLTGTSGSIADQKTSVSAEGESSTPVDSGPDPNTLPVATAPPSHPKIDPSIPGTLDGRSILEVDLNALSEKPWRRPGSDLSDWFNYGFDEISWEAYCYRRREIGELAAMIKGNVVQFAGMPEEQLAALPPEIRTMVMAGATAVMAQGGGPGPGGMMPTGPGAMNPMMSQMMNMGPMMNPMMQDMGVVGMGGDMGPMGMGGDMGPMGMDGGVMQPGPSMGGGGGGGGGLSGGVTMGTSAIQQQGGPGDQVVPTGPGGQMGMAMGGDFNMQESMGQQMTGYQGMDTSGPGPGPGPATGPAAQRGIPTGPQPSQFRGRMPPMMRGAPPRGTGFAGRGRPLPIRPSSPLPPNVPTGPRNKNKYKDVDGSAPAVEGLDYGGGSSTKESGRGTPDYDERSSRKRRNSPSVDDGRGSKRR
ncbi:FIP1 family protein [Abortiporus biennis]